MKSTSLLVGSLAIAATTAFSQTTPQPQAVPSPAVAANYGKLPLSFEANQGQSDPQVQFLSRGQGYSLFLTDSAAVLSLTKSTAPSRPSVGLRRSQRSQPNQGNTDVIRMELAGATPNLRITGADQLPGKANYFLGKDPAKWHSNVPTYSKVKYSAVYPGIDLVYYGNQSQLEYDFVVAPNADPKPVKLHFAGADKLKLNTEGDLEIIAKEGQIAFHKPVVYQVKSGQTKDGQRETVEGEFQLLANNTVSFQLGAYDHSRELVIDPVLAYSTYLGGRKNDEVLAIAVDSGGNAYLAGVSESPDFPVTTGSLQTPLEGLSKNVFVSKLNSSGSALLYSAYFGPAGSPYYYLGSQYGNYLNGMGIAVDAEGNAYLTANALAGADFPVTSGAFQTVSKATNGQQQQPFVLKLNPAGSALVYSTYLGGSSGFDSAGAIAVDAVGNAYVTGLAGSTDFPVTGNAFQKQNKASPYLGNTFVAKVNPAGSALVYSTYLGGSGSCQEFFVDLGDENSYYTYDCNGDYGTAIALDSSGSAYVTGLASSQDFPVTAEAFQKVNKNGGNAFIAKLNPAGSALKYSTFLGGSGYFESEEYYVFLGDQGNAIAVDGSGNVTVAGTSNSTDFPTTSGAFHTSLNAGASNAGFVSKVDPTGSSLIYSTYLGGGSALFDTDSCLGLTIDKSGNAYVAGVTYTQDFPVTPDAFQKVNRGKTDASSAFFTELNSDGSAPLYSTYFGGSAGGVATGLARDGAGNTYIAGLSSSPDLPVTSRAFQNTKKSPSTHSPGINPYYTGFVAKFGPHGATLPNITITPNANPQNSGQPVTFTVAVASSDGGTTPTGSVNLSIDGSFIPHIDLDGAGQAIYNAGLLSVGPHTVSASYHGDADNATNDTSIVQTVFGQLPPPILSPLSSTTSYSRLVTITNPVAGASCHYTTDGSIPGARSPFCVSSLLVSSTETIKAIAVLSGYTASAVASATYTINRKAIATSTSVQSSANPSFAGDPITFTATVKPISGATPTGTVTFLHTTVVMGTAPLVNGVATFTTSALGPNTGQGYGIIAVYTGSSTDSGSVSPTLAQKVNP